MSLKEKLIIAILSLFKLWLVAAIPLTVIGNAGHDDRLFLNLAFSLVQGEWLGPYNQLTLIKGPMYSMWLAFNFYLGLPLLFAQHFLYMGAGLMLVIALKKVINSSFILVFLYALFIFSPHLEVVTRVIREGIYPALAVFVLSGLIGLYLNRSEKLRHLGAWATFLGITLSALWLTREEGLWIIPAVLLIMAYMIFQLYKSYHWSLIFWKRTVICLLPLFILFGNLQLVSFLNKTYYGIYTVVELKSESFLSAFGALSRVKHPHWIRYLPVPKKVRQSIYQVSPAFQELQIHLEKRLSVWEASGCHLYPETCGDIAGGWFLWALREAVTLAGYHQSGEKANHYYARLASEINTACNNGILDCLPERATLMPPLTTAYIKPTLEAFKQSVGHLAKEVNYPIYIHNNLASSGNKESLALFHTLTHEQLAPLPSQKKRAMTMVRGWAFSLKDKSIYFQVKSPQSNSLEEVTLERVLRLDVYAHVKKQIAKNYEPAKNSGFVINSSCVKQCELIILNQQSVLAIIDLTTKQPKFRSNDLWFHLDSITQAERSRKEQLPMQTRINQVKISILQNIAKVYQLIIPWFSLLAVVAYMASFGVGILQRHFSFLFILNTAIIGAIVTRLLILALIEATSFPTMNLMYMSPLYPFLLIFSILTLVDLREIKMGKKNVN